MIILFFRDARCKDDISLGHVKGTCDFIFKIWLYWLVVQKWRMVVISSSNEFDQGSILAYSHGLYWDETPFHNGGVCLSFQNMMLEFVTKHCDDREIEEWKTSKGWVSRKVGRNNVEKNWLLDALFHEKLKYLLDLVSRVLCWLFVKQYNHYGFN